MQATELHKDIHAHGGLSQAQQTLGGGSAPSSSAKVFIYTNSFYILNLFSYFTWFFYAYYVGEWKKQE